MAESNENKTKAQKLMDQSKRKFGKKVESNYAEPWKPTAAGETLEGIYLGFDLIPGERDEKFRSYRIKVDNQEKPMGVAGAYLDSILPRIPVGEAVLITYKGKEKVKNGTAHTWDVQVEEGTKLLDIPATSTAFDE